MASATAAVLTISDGVTHGTRVDASGDEAASALGAAGFEVATREVVPDERAEIEAALDAAGERPRPRRHHGRHGVRSSRRDARGDEGRARTGGAGAGGADACRGPVAHADGGAVPRDRRHDRRGAHREPAGLAVGGAGIVGRAPARAAPRGRAARRRDGRASDRSRHAERRRRGPRPRRRHGGQGGGRVAAVSRGDAAVGRAGRRGARHARLRRVRRAGDRRRERCDRRRGAGHARAPSRATATSRSSWSRIERRRACSRCRPPTSRGRCGDSSNRWGTRW